MANKPTGSTGNTDITTLAIELQSREAEAGLKNFNDLMIDASKLASSWKAYKIDIDAQGALEQLRSLKGEYIDMASAARQSMADVPAIDLHVNKPAFGDDPKYGMLVEGFRQTQEQARLLHDEISRITQSFDKFDEWTDKLDNVASGHVRASSSVKTVSVATEEYIRTMKELAAARKEFDSASAKADAAGEAVNAADERAAAVKKDLTAAQRELNSVTKQLAATHTSYSGDVLGLAEREEILRKKLSELKSEYTRASTEVDKYVEKLDHSATAADTAKAKYDGLKEKLAGLPPPVEKTGFEMGRLSPQVTRLTRGVNGLMAVTGSAIPGVYGLGSAVNMLSMATTKAGAALTGAGIAVAAGVGIYQSYAGAMKIASDSAREMAAESVKKKEAFVEQINVNRAALDRLRELNSYDTLYDAQKEESAILVGKLTKAYKNLGLEYDIVTGKVKGLSGAQEILNEQDEAIAKKKLENQYKTAKQHLELTMAEAARDSVTLPRFIGELPAQLAGKGTINEMRSFFKALEGLSHEDQINAIDELMNKAHEVRVSEGILNTMAIYDAEKVYKALEKVKEAKESFWEKDEELLEFQLRGMNFGDDKEVSETSERMAALEKEARKTAEAMRELYDEKGKGTGVFRLATEAELLQVQGKRLDELIKKREELRGMKDDAVDTYEGKAMTVAEARLRAEKDIKELTKQRLLYEERKRNEFIILQKKLEESKSGFVYDKSGDIARHKTQSELSGERVSEIRELREKISIETDENKKIEYELKLNDLKEQQFKEQENAQKALMGDLNKMKDSLTRFRDTTQTAVTADSIEGLRLQSRQMNIASDHQKNTAENTRKMSEALNTQENIFNNIGSMVSNIFDKIEEIKASGV